MVEKFVINFLSNPLYTSDSCQRKKNINKYSLFKNVLLQQL